MTPVRRLSLASSVIATILSSAAFIVVADNLFRSTTDHTLWLGHCLSGNPWKAWAPILAGSVALFGLSVILLLVTRALRQGLRVVLLTPILLYSLWLGLWGLVVQILSVDDSRLTSTPTLIPFIQGLAAVYTQVLHRARSMKARITGLAIVVVATPAIWLPSNYLFGRAMCA